MKKRNQNPKDAARQTTFTSAPRAAHPLLPSCVRHAGPFSELFLAEVLPTLPAWRPGAELVQEHAALHALFASIEDPGELLPQVIARTLEHLGHKPEAAKTGAPFIARSPTGEATATILIAPYQNELAPHRDDLLRAMKSHNIRWGFLTNGVLWQLHSAQEERPAYEVAPEALLQASFFSEPFRYFSLFFRASSFPQFVDDALSGSDATEAASLTALSARATQAKRDLAREQIHDAHLPRALFAITAAANGLAPFPELVVRVRANDDDAAKTIAATPSLPNALSLDHRWLARLIRDLTPDDTSDPSGLRDVRLRGVSWFAPFVSAVMQAGASTPKTNEDPTSREHIERQRENNLRATRWALSYCKERALFFALTQDAPTQITALFEELHPKKRDAASRLFSLSPAPWQAELTRLSLWLSGVRDEALLRQHRFGHLAIDSKEQLLAAVQKQASLFTAVTQSAIERANIEQDRGWLSVLCDALAAQHSEIPAGFETLLSFIQTPSKLVSQPSVDRSHQWAKSTGAYHWWLAATPAHDELLLFADHLDAPIQRLLALHANTRLVVRVSPASLKRSSSAALRRQILQEASLASIFSSPNAQDLILLTRQTKNQEVLFIESTNGQTTQTSVPEENLRQHPGSPWTLLRQSRAITLAARIQARSTPLRELLVAVEPGQIFLGEESASLRSMPELVPYRLRDKQYAPGYLVACSLSAALHFVRRVDELSLLSLPIPQLRLQQTPEERSRVMASVKPLLLANRAEALLAHVAQQLAKGVHDLAHDVLAESAKTGHCIDTLPKMIIGLLLGLSEDEANLIASLSPSPSPLFIAKPLPVHVPAVKVEREQRERLLAALKEKKTMTSHEAQGVTGLDSRKLRQLLTDLELAGEISRTGRGSGTLYHAK